MGAYGVRARQYRQSRVNIVKVRWNVLAVAASGLLLVVPLGRALWTGGSGGSNPIDISGRTATPASRTATPKQRLVAPTVVQQGGGPGILLNPSMARPGTDVSLSGFDFDPASVVSISMRVGADTQGTAVGRSTVDGWGSFSAGFTVPTSVGNGPVTVIATEAGSDKTAHAEATVPSGAGSVELSRQTGRPGDHVVVNAMGFAPGETVDVYWGRLTGRPAATLQADTSGAVWRAPLRVGITAAGETTLALVGITSRTVASSRFLLLSLYPTVDVAPYALKGGTRLSFSATGFAPDERVLVFVNRVGGSPAAVVQAGDDGAFTGAGITIPFGLSEHQTLVLIGERTRASATSGFLVLPYTPSVQPSTYSGLPGTSLSFYASGFAAGEVVQVYLQHAPRGPGDLVSAFKVDGSGAAYAAGAYLLSSHLDGRVWFRLVGKSSGTAAVAAVIVQRAAAGSRDVPSPPRYVLPADLAGEPRPPSPSPSPSSPAGMASTASATAAG